MESIKELDPSLDENQWQFFTNSKHDIPQQKNGYDCGVYVCLYAQSLVMKSPLCDSASISSFRRHMIVEIHGKELQDLTEGQPQLGKYYAVQ